MTTLTRQDLNFGQGSVLCYAANCYACKASCWHMSLWTRWRVALSLDVLQLKGKQLKFMQGKNTLKKIPMSIWCCSACSPPHYFNILLLLFSSCCRCSFRISGSGCSPYLVCQRSLPYWDLSEEEKIQCTCPGRRFSWKLTATWTSKNSRDQSTLTRTN